jgi:glycosyltransferase involved in cell wall biosynthesis
LDVPKDARDLIGRREFGVALTVIGPIVLAYRGVGRRVDAIRDYTTLLARQISLQGTSTQTAIGDQHGVWRVAGADGESSFVTRQFHDAVAGARWLIVQYNPFSYGRWGIAPWLPWRLSQTRARADLRIALMCHEVYPPFALGPAIVAALAQRLQLAAITRSADLVFASTTAGIARIRRWSPATEAKHLPVGSNLPDARARRHEGRGRLSMTDGDLVIAAFGTDHPSRPLDYIRQAIEVIAAERRIYVLNLGLGAFDLDLPTEIRSLRPGMLAAEDLALHLAAADLCLLPYSDGASTRRGTLAAALQHELCVVTTYGHNTDPVLASSGLCLTPVGSREAFAAAALSFARDPVARRTAAQTGRALYERTFAWSAVADRLLMLLRAAEVQASVEAG